MTAIDIILAPKIELAIRSIIASFGRDATSVTTNSQPGEHVGITVPFEKASENTNKMHMSIVNDETRDIIPDEVSELSVPETRFDRQSQNHHMVTGQTAETNQILLFLTGRNLTPRNPPSRQHQRLSAQVLHDNFLPMVEQTPRNKSSDGKNSINCLSDAIAAIATQQRPQATKVLKPVSITTIILDGKNERFELFEDQFHIKLKMQTEMTEAMKITKFHAHF